MEERGADGDVRAEAELARHDAGEERDLLRVVQDVLAVAGAELQPAHQLEHVGMQVVQPQLERRRLAVLADGVVHLAADFLDDLLDARRMDAAVGDQPLDRPPRDLAPEGIEAREDDRAGRVVDDQVDAGRELERADVAALAADDAALHVVARQIDDGDRGLDGVVGGAALDGLGDDGAGAVGGLLARFGLEALDQARGVAPRVGFDLLDQQLARLVAGQAGEPLEIAAAAARRALRSGPRWSRRSARACSAPARGVPARGRAPRSACLLFDERRLALDQHLLDAGNLLPVIARVLLGLDAQLVRALLGLEHRFLAPRVGFALRVAQDARRLFLGAADGLGGEALAVGEPIAEDRGGARRMR